MGSAIGKSDRSSSRPGKPISLRPKGADQSEIAVVRGSQFENSPDDGYGREGICLEVSQGWRNASTPVALGSHAGAKNTGSLAASEVANRSMIAGHWWRRSWTTSWCSVHSDPITRLGRLRRSALVLRDPWMNWGSSVIFMDSTHRRISLA